MAARRGLFLLALVQCRAFLLSPSSPRALTVRHYLEEVVRGKLQEVEGLNAKHASGADSDVRSRLSFMAGRGNVRFSSAMRRVGDDGERLVSVVADVKRRSPHGGRDGGSTVIAAFEDAGAVAAEVNRWPVDGLSVCADGRAYGGTLEDVSAARRAVAGLEAERPPICFKDFVVDPIQIAVAAELGADAVLLSATVLGGRLLDLLDTATVVGVECLVEVHTPNECQFALNAGATLLLCTNVDRTTGVYHENQALGLKGFIPPNIVALAGGGVTDLNQARALAAAGYDGVVLGRKLLEDPASAEALVRQIRDIAVAPVDQLAWG